MRKLALLSILLSGPVLGGEHIDRGVVRVLNEANQQKLVSGQTALCLPLLSNSSAQSKNNAQDMNDCVVALCGTPDENPSVFLTDKNFSKYITPEIKTKLSAIEPNIKKLINKEKGNSIKMLDEIQEKIKTTHPETWTPELRSDLSYRMFSPYMEEKIDLKKPPGERILITLKDDQKLDPGLRKALEDYRVKFQSFVKTDVNSFLERGLYSSDEQKQMATERLTKLKEVYAQVSDKMNKYEREDVRSRIAGYLKELKNVDDENLPVAMLNVSNIEDQVSAYLPANSLKPLKPTCENEVICNESFKKYITESGMLPAIAAAKSKINDPATFNKQYNFCKAKIVAGLSVSSQQKNAEKLVAEVKKQMSKNVFSHFSAHSRGLIENYFKSKIAIGSTSIQSKLSETDPYESYKILIEGNLKSDYTPLGLDEENSITTALSISEEGFDSSESLGFCTPEMSSNAFDAYLAYEKVKKFKDVEKKVLAKIPPKDNLFISPFSCHHELRGKSVVAHELGHAINQIFAAEKLSETSAKKFKELRKCSTDNYTEFIPDRVSFIHEGDAVRSEEDSADVFAYMAYPDQGDLFSCSLIMPSLDSNSYDDLSIINNDGDSHSTSLYRLILEAINKNKNLPVSCQRALEPVKDQLRLKKCAL